MTNIVRCSNIVHKMVNITYITEFENVQNEGGVLCSSFLKSEIMSRKIMRNQKS